jgi:hypothetical protein
MRKAGFKEVRVLQEKVYPIDYIISEPEAQETINSLGLIQEQVAGVANSVVSVSVSASKR